MPKDVDYKEVAKLFYNNEDAANRPIKPVWKLGVLRKVEEDIRSYIEVRPEFHLLAYDKGSLTELNGTPITIMELIFRGYYFIDKDLNLIKTEEIYDCWLDTANQIIEFLNRNRFIQGMQGMIPAHDQLKDEISEFLHHLRNIKYNQ